MINPADFEAGKPNNKCITCEYFGDICTGTNLLAMVEPESSRPLERLGEFCRMIKVYRQKQDAKWTNQYIADTASVSKATVDKFFAGSVDDIKVSTLVRIYKVLLDGKWAEIPCSLDVFASRLSAGQDELKKLREENQLLQEKLTYVTEDAEQYKELADKYWRQMETKDTQLEDRKSALNYRGRIIIFLIVLCLAFCALAIFGLSHDAIRVI